MDLLHKQFAFSTLVAKLILKANELGYQVTLGETWRSMGTRPSLHPLRLAIDINLFKNEAWLDKTENHKELGEWWETQSTQDFSCTWGGRFSIGDGNHYSIMHNGVR